MIPTVVQKTNQTTAFFFFRQKKSLLSSIAAYSCCFFLFLFHASSASAQNASTIDTAYENVIRVRTAKIVNNLGIQDSVTYQQVHQLLQKQYIALNKVHDQYKTLTASIKKYYEGKTSPEAAIKTASLTKQQVIKSLHDTFLTDLTSKLDAGQIEKVKDGMTYGVLPLTWNAYLDMLHQLTPEQKSQMYSWLVEARELAMDEGSSDAKHAVFGKYKGKINNYLSAAGYDMKKEGEDWAKRIKAAKEENKPNN